MVTAKRIEITIGNRTAVFPVTGEPAVERGTVSVRFEAPEKSLTIPAGAPITIKLMGSDTVLEWDRRPSAVMPFDLFAREPVIIRPGAKVERALGVTVRILPANRGPTRPLFTPDFAVGR